MVPGEPRGEFPLRGEGKDRFGCGQGTILPIPRHLNCEHVLACALSADVDFSVRLSYHAIEHSAGDLPCRERDVPGVVD